MPRRKKSKSGDFHGFYDSGASTPDKPRRDPQQRLLSRFYEPLVLLHTLGRTRGERIPRPLNGELADLSTCQLRRSFLDSLAYVCDYDKGGDTVTAIGLESRPQGPIFWISANKNPGPRVTCFLEDTLKKLRKISRKPEKNIEEKVQSIARDCINFGRNRIKKYWSCLTPLLRQCLATLSSQDSNQDSCEGRELYHWLKSISFDPANPFTLCQWCYETRKAPQMQYLRIWSQEHTSRSDNGFRSSPFQQVRHYIGRLGYHFRATACLVAAARRLPYLFEDFEVRCVETPPVSYHPPTTDAKTTFDSIILRMLPSNATDDVLRYQSKLTSMNEKFGLYSRFMSSYKDPNFRPRVHCELALLEHYYTKNLPFVDSDRYIGCSKPACYCCALYVRNHPGGFVEPASHQKIYLNWRPPDLVWQDQEKARIHQRDILNSIISILRREALRQISECSSPSQWHPDSTTGTTNSGDSMREPLAQEGKGVTIKEGPSHANG